MKTHYTFFFTGLIMLLSFHGNSQNKVKFTLHANQNLTTKINNQRGLIDVLVKGDVAAIKETVQLLGGKFKYNSGNIAAISIPADKKKELSEKSFVLQLEESNYTIYPLNDSMRQNANVDSAQAGYSPLLKGYDGKDVVIGFIDFGIDFNHADFKDSTGKTRIKYLWDHRDTIAGRQPAGFTYGTEWKSSAIDSGLCTHNPNLYGGHGTSVAGIAAGDGSDSSIYKGVAPKADIISVVLDANSPIADALQYIYSKADSLGKPCVINASFGIGHSVLNAGTDGAHDGSDLLSQTINNLITAKSGRSFVCAIGNDGASVPPFHLGYQVTSDSSFTWFKFNPVTFFGPMLLFELWADTLQFNNVEIAVGMDRADSVYSFRGRTSYYKIADLLPGTVTQSIINGANTLAVINFDAVKRGNKYLIQIYTTAADSNQYLFRFITKGSGTFDIWSSSSANLSKTCDMVYSSLPDSVNFPDILRYKLPDNYKSLQTSFTCSDKVLTVGSFINKPSGTIGDIQSSSSKGYTRDERVKPEVTSAGGNITSCKVGGGYQTNAATSFASPIVTGVAAFYLQKYPYATYQDVRNAIINSAIKDSFTGSTPNKTWGYGKVNAFRALIDWLPALTPQASSDTICLGDSTTLSTTGATSYWWAKTTSPNDTIGINTSIVVAPTSNTSYILAGKDSAGFSKKDTITIVVNLLPVITSSDVSSCKNDSVDLIVSGGLYYTWWDYAGDSITNNDTITVNTDTSTSYFVVGVDINGCINIDTAHVWVDTLPVLKITASTDTICKGDTVTLIASGALYYDWFDIKWNFIDSAITVDLIPDSTTYFIAEGTDSNSCTGTDSVKIWVGNPGIADVTATGSDTSLCIGDTVKLNAALQNAKPIQFLWSPGGSTDSTILVIPSSTTSFSCLITDNYSCTYNDSVKINVNPLPVVNIGTDTTCIVIPGDTCTIVLNAGNIGSSYLWSTGDTTQSITLKYSSVYSGIISVAVTDINTCKQNDSTNITIISSLIDEPGFISGFYVYPNPFNDKVVIYYNLIKQGFVTLRIYNILGEEVITIANEKQINGNYSYNFNIGTSGHSNGVYILKMTIDDKEVGNLKLIAY